MYPSFLISQTSLSDLKEYKEQSAPYTINGDTFLWLAHGAIVIAIEQLREETRLLV